MEYKRETKDLLIKIRTSQSAPAEGITTEPVELMTEARRVKKNGVYYIIYEESELSGTPGCITSIKVDGEEVSLRRFGTYAQEMRFREGKPFVGLYDTPIGMVDMEINTNEVKNELCDDGTKGRLFLDFNVNLRGLLEARNTMEIKIAPLERKNRTGGAPMNLA